MDISGFNNVKLQEAPTINEPKKIKRIREEKAKMDESYFKAILDKITFHEREFNKNKDADHEYLKEIQRLEHEKAEIIYLGYEEILNKPERIQMIENKVKSELNEIEEQKKVYLRLVNGRQGVI